MTRLSQSVSDATPQESGGVVVPDASYQRKIDDMKRVAAEMLAAKATGTYTGWIATPVNPDGSNDPAQINMLRVRAKLRKAEEKRLRATARFKKTGRRVVYQKNGEVPNPRTAPMSDLRLVDKFNVAYPEMYSQFVQISRELKNRVPNYSGREVFSTIKTNRVMAGLSSFTMGHNLQTQYLRAVEQRETDLTGFFTDTGSRAYTKDKARVAPVVGPTKKSKTKPAKRVSAIDTVYLKILGSVESGLNEREIVKVTNYQRETVCSILNKLRSTGRTRLTEIERPGGKVYIANL